MYEIPLSIMMQVFGLWIIPMDSVVSFCQVFFFFSIVIAILRTVQEYEIFTFTSKSWLTLTSKSESMNKSLWSSTEGARSPLKWNHIPPTCPLLPSEAVIVHECKHVRAGNPGLCRESTWAPWPLFESLRSREREPLCVLDREVADTEPICHSKASTWKFSFVFKPLEAFVRLQPVCVYNQLSHPQPFTVIMCSHTKSLPKTPHYFP